MSHGLQTIHALLAEGNQAAFRRLRDEMFTSDELPAWSFLRDYHQRFGGVPALAAFQENGLQLVAATGSFEYHFERLMRRTIYNTVQANYRPLTEALDIRDMDGVAEALNVLQSEVARVRAEASMATLSEWAQRIREIYRRAHARGEENGVTLGWAPLDSLTHGAYPGDVVALVGRPGEGKTYTMLHMALAAWREGRQVLFLSEEMTDEQVALRAAGLHSRVDPTYIRRGRLSTWTWRSVEQALGDFEDQSRPRFDLVSGSLKHTVKDVDALVQELGPDIVYIDASYLLRPSTGGRNRSRWELLADVGEGIKEMALRRDVPVVHSVQFNRQQKQSQRNRAGDATRGMSLDNIGGTDVVAQVASIVIGIRGGLPPHERTRRQFAVLKNREGSLSGFSTNFLFAPIDFDVVQDDAEDEEQREREALRQEQAMQDLSESMM